jgi:hypothetical protein
VIYYQKVYIIPIFFALKEKGRHVDLKSSKATEVVR